jgi:hypothetical protein
MSPRRGQGGCYRPSATHAPFLRKGSVAVVDQNSVALRCTSNVAFNPLMLRGLSVRCSWALYVAPATLRLQRHFNVAPSGQVAPSPKAYERD